jgi:Tol biopolymer transport system component
MSIAPKFLAVVLSASFYAVAGAPAVHAETCPNAAIRQQQSSTQLPECRAYEMVTPVDKNGGDTVAVTSSPDGDRLAFYSDASFAGLEVASTINSYVAQRGADGWTTRPMLSRLGMETPSLAFNGQYYGADFTEDLSESIAFSRSGGAEPTVMNVFLMKLDGSSSWLTAPTVTGTSIDDKAYAGRSADGSHIVFESSEPFSNEATAANGHQVWEWVNGHMRLASILPDGTVPVDGAGVGSGVNGAEGGGTTFLGTLREPDVVSEDGSKIFFGLGGAGTHRVFVRIDGTETRELTLSQRTGSVGQAPNTSSFAGASADGNVGVFVSPEQLTNDATVNGGLYAFDLRTGVLRFLSSGATDPDGAQFEGASLVSRDGSRVFFVARSVLVAGKGVAGGRNLYVSDKDGVSFIATLADNDVPATARATADGRYFVFQSWAQITDFENRGHQEVYLYDAKDKTVACVSCGAASHTAGGDASILATPSPAQYGRPRVLTDNGDRVFFQTTDSLVAQDVNDKLDVYEYWTATGVVSLISAGTGGYDSEIADNSPDGGDVYFSTRDALVGRDTDGGAKDIYDARVGGGFPESPDVMPCAGDACHGQPSVPPAIPTAGSVMFLGGGNVGGDGVVSSRSALSTSKVKVSTPRTIRGASVLLAIKTPSGGKLTVSGAGLETVRKSGAEAGSYELKVVLTARAKATLVRKHSLKISVRVVFKSNGGKSSTAIVLLMFKAPSMKKGR